jgi:hypothetical protein
MLVWTANPDVVIPQWSLTGIAVMWPDGQSAALSQSPWCPNEDDGWTCIVLVPRCEKGVTRFLRTRVHANGRHWGRDSDWIRARDLIVQRMRSAQAPVEDLGEIIV